MDYFYLNFKIPIEVKNSLLKIGTETLDKDYYNHISSKSKKYTNLQFLFEEKISEISKSVLDKFKIKPDNISIIKIQPNLLVDWHIDAPNFKRNTVIIFPLCPKIEDYAACETKQGLITPSECYAFNTTVMHKVQNNQYVRLSLQLFFQQDIYELNNLYITNNLIDNE